MAFGPFQGNGDGSSLEHDDALSNATKQAVKAVNNQTSQQTQAAKQSFVDQLYGNVANSPEPLDPNIDPMQAAAKAQSQSAGAATAANNGLMPAVNPNEQSKLEETRRQLSEMQKLHDQNYFGPTFGEEAHKKQEQQEAAEKQEKAEQEQAELEEAEAEKQRQAESLQAFTLGKNKGKGPDQLSAPVAVTQAKTRTEINRGTSG